MEVPIMRVLVSAASRHGSTADIAKVIAEVLRMRGLEVDITAPHEVASVDAYDAVIIGSAVYTGHWLPDASALVAREADRLASRPVWLFSSGPIGDPPKPETGPSDVGDLADRIGAREHRIFAGALDKGRLGLGERSIVAVVRAPEGDYRRWDEIRDWASGVATELTTPDAATPAPAVIR
jgi:menaquinone-dependent protoporphyrinogen oxidase